MGFLSAVLGVLVGGYILGIWTDCTVFCDRQHAYEDGVPEQLWKPSLIPSPEVAWIPGVESMNRPALAVHRLKATNPGPFSRSSSSGLSAIANLVARSSHVGSEASRPGRPLVASSPTSIASQIGLGGHQP